MNLSIERERLYKNLIAESSNTPLIELKKLKFPNNNRVFLKLEYKNPVGSIHMRVYPYVFRKAEILGFIMPGITPVIEASFGNAGAAFAYCARQLGFDKPNPPKVVVPETISRNRLSQLLALGAQLIFSPRERFNIGYVERLEEELKLDRSNREITTHIDPTRLYPITKTRKEAKEAYKNLVDEAIKVINEHGLSTFDFFVGIIGSGTSISGISERLKEVNPSVKIIASEPDEFRNTSSLVQTGKPLPISIVPDNFPPLAAIGVPINKLNLNTGVIDHIERFKVSLLRNIVSIIEEEYDISIGFSTAGPLLTILAMAERTNSKSYLVCAYDELKKWE